MQLQPPTKDEVARTIFIGGITEGVGSDEEIERILRAAGNLRRWIRATDADEKACKFGFAEYEDPESLSTAVEVLKDVEVPVKKQQTSGADGEEKEVEKSKLLVCSGFLFAFGLDANVYRLLSMKALISTWNTTKRTVTKTQQRSSRALKLPDLL